MTPPRALRLCCAALAAASPLAHSQSSVPSPSQLIGTWRGTSLCSDRVAAPACKDETVVYEFTPGPKPGEVHWAADKVVDGKRVPMGEFDLAYDKPSACWRSEFQSPRVHLVWCLTVDGDRLSGTGTLLPGKQTVRKIDAHKDKS